MFKPIATAVLLVVSALVLGSTVFREQVAWAAQAVDAHITNLDANGNIMVHEQGTVRDADQPALQPFQRYFEGRFAGNQFSACDTAAVPAAKRLVIESVSFRSYLLDSAESYVQVSVENTAGGVRARHWIEFVQVPTEPHAWHGSELVRLYADPETTVSMCADRVRLGFTTPHFNGSISGHLVTLP